MNTRKIFKKTVIPVILILLTFISAFSQSPNFPQPQQQEKLLNGLKLLIWSEPQAPKATVKVRIHSGAAFDPKDKMGTMALLSDILFPTEQAKEFFREDLEGSLDLTTNYDYLQITATGKPEEILAILETLSAAVTNPQITKENFALVRQARLERVNELEKNSAYVADQAIARRLFGDFPYGRSVEGTSASLAKIEPADLLQIRDRLFTADNTTIAVTGNVKPDFVYRAVRRLFGGWKKSESKIPATFRLPDAPDTTQLTIEMPNSDKNSFRSALAMPARNDKDFYAAQIVSKIWQTKFCLSPGNEANFGNSVYQPFLLRGAYIYSQNGSNTLNGQIKELPIYSGPAERRCQLILQKDGKMAYPPISQADFDQAKAAVVSDFQQKAQTPVNLADVWLDVDTYKLVSVKDEFSKLNNVTFADAQRVADNLQKQPQVRVIVKKAETAASN